MEGTKSLRRRSRVCREIFRAPAAVMATAAAAAAAAAGADVAAVAVLREETSLANAGNEAVKRGMRMNRLKK